VHGPSFAEKTRVRDSATAGAAWRTYRNTSGSKASTGTDFEKEH